MRRDACDGFAWEKDGKAKDPSSDRCSIRVRVDPRMPPNSSTRPPSERPEVPAPMPCTPKSETKLSDVFTRFRWTTYSSSSSDSVSLDASIALEEEVAIEDRITHLPDPIPISEQLGVSLDCNLLSRIAAHSITRGRRVRAVRPDKVGM